MYKPVDRAYALSCINSPYIEYILTYAPYMLAYGIVGSRLDRRIITIIEQVCYRVGVV